MAGADRTGQKSYILYDYAHRFCTRLVPEALFIMMCVCFISPRFSDQIHCASSNFMTPEAKRLLNDFCWNLLTVRIPLNVTMKGQVLHPSVSKNKPETEKDISQQFCLCLAVLFVTAYIPHLFWKAAECTEKLESLLNFAPVHNVPKMKTMVSNFKECRGLSNKFALKYLSSKLLAIFTIILQWVVAVQFFGVDFRLYGWNVLVEFLGYADHEPNPMTVVFPTMANCERKWYGINGDIEIRSAICQLPLNDYAKWIFLIYWWMLAIPLVMNILTIIYLLLMKLPHLRIIQYRRYIKNVCREDVERARTCKDYHVDTNGRSFLVSKQTIKESVIRIDISYGVWLLLDIMSRNMQDVEFRAFIRELAVTENTRIKIVPTQLSPEYHQGRTHTAIQIELNSVTKTSQASPVATVNLNN